MEQDNTQLMEEMFYLARHLGVQPSEAKTLSAYERKWLIEKHITEKMLEVGKKERSKGEFYGCKDATKSVEPMKSVGASYGEQGKWVKISNNQAGNFQQWQDSTNKVLATVTNSGKFVSSYGTLIELRLTAEQAEKYLVNPKDLCDKKPSGAHSTVQVKIN